MEVVQVDLYNDVHVAELMKLIDVYMQDDMGDGKPMKKGLENKILKGLRMHQAYVGFFIKDKTDYIALANCNMLFSTFKAKPIINIHDLIVLPAYRKKGIGQRLLKAIEDFGIKNDCCRISLEVRDDNLKAQNLYKKFGFVSGNPPMLFWEKNLI